LGRSTAAAGSLEEAAAGQIGSKVVVAAAAAGSDSAEEEHSKDLIGSAEIEPGQEQRCWRVEAIERLVNPDATRHVSEMS
jgi:hypothetical protein